MGGIAEEFGTLKFIPSDKHLEHTAEEDHGIAEIQLFSIGILVIRLVDRSALGGRVAEASNMRSCRAAAVEMAARRELKGQSQFLKQEN
jgi:hypothetical protein